MGCIKQAMRDEEAADFSHAVATAAYDTAEKAVTPSYLIGGCSFLICFRDVKAPASEGFDVAIFTRLVQDCPAT